jgi:hypothetical protein
MAWGDPPSPPPSQEPLGICWESLPSPQGQESRAQRAAARQQPLSSAPPRSRRCWSWCATTRHAPPCNSASRQRCQRQVSANPEILWGGHGILPKSCCLGPLGPLLAVVGCWLLVCVCGLWFVVFVVWRSCSSQLLPGPRAQAQAGPTWSRPRAQRPGGSRRGPGAGALRLSKKPHAPRPARPTPTPIAIAIAIAQRPSPIAIAHDGPWSMSCSTATTACCLPSRAKRAKPF